MFHITGNFCSILSVTSLFDFALNALNISRHVIWDVRSHVFTLAKAMWKKTCRKAKAKENQCNVSQIRLVRSNRSHVFYRIAALKHSVKFKGKPLRCSLLLSINYLIIVSCNFRKLWWVFIGRTHGDTYFNVLTCTLKKFKEQWQLK